MKFKRVIFILFVIQIHYGDATNKSDLISTNYNLCTNDKCIMKCCGAGKFLKEVTIVSKHSRTKRKICDNYNVTDAHGLERELNHIFIRKPNISIFEIKSNVILVNKTFQSETIEVTKFGYNFYLNEKSEVVLETPNAYDRLVYIPNNLYCIDSEMTSGENIFRPGVWVVFEDAPTEIDQPKTIIFTVGMVVSCFFLVLVLIVYGMLPELRNLCGMILMAYVTSQLGAFLMLIVMRSKSHEQDVCEGLTYVIYFFFMASFSWMNVMSFDIWWTFRGYAKSRPIHRRGERFKFNMYCLYAFGLPLAMTIALAIVNRADLTHVPWFVTPKIPAESCFIKGGEKLLYLYVPMLILILCNWLLYILTAMNIWKLSQGTAVLESGPGGSSQARRLNKKRFFIYLKLSVVMGLNWLLELASYYYEDSVIWYITDSYNMLIGVAIFVIFVCKRKILNKLRKRFTNRGKSNRYPGQEESSRSATTGEYSCTQEMLAVPLDNITYKK